MHVDVERLRVSGDLYSLATSRPHVRPRRGMVGRGGVCVELQRRGHTYDRVEAWWAEAACVLSCNVAASTTAPRHGELQEGGGMAAFVLCDDVQLNLART